LVQRFLTSIFLNEARRHQGHLCQRNLALQFRM
jgi:hypothetical protein